jgi:hypothetical protein
MALPNPDSDPPKDDAERPINTHDSPEIMGKLGANLDAPPDTSFADLQRIAGIPTTAPLIDVSLIGVDLAGANPSQLIACDLRGAKLGALTNTSIESCVIDSQTVLPNAAAETYWISVGAKPNTLIGRIWRGLADEVGLPSSVIRNRQRPLQHYEGTYNVHIAPEAATLFMVVFEERARLALVYHALSRQAIKLSAIAPAISAEDIARDGYVLFRFEYTPSQKAIADSLRRGHPVENVDLFPYNKYDHLVNSFRDLQNKLGIPTPKTGRVGDIALDQYRQVTFILQTQQQAQDMTRLTGDAYKAASRNYNPSRYEI